MVRLPTTRRCNAFTLLELLLVLALMVAALAVALPNLKSSFSNQRLQKAAEQIRAEWTRARVRAIKTGQTQVFRHAVYSRRFSTSPLVSWEDELEASPFRNPSMLGNPSLGNPSMSTRTQTSRNLNPGGQYPNSRSSTLPNRTTNPLQAVDDSWTLRWRELPRDVVFMGADVRLDQRTMTKLSTMPTEPLPDFSVLDQDEGLLPTETSWGTPVFFFPDGTTSTVRLVLTNEQQRTVEVWLRGLTGTVRVGRVQSLAPIAPTQEALP